MPNKITTAEELETLAMESTTPEAVDVLEIIETGKLNDTASLPAINAFAEALVSDGTLTITDASRLIEDAKVNNSNQVSENDPETLIDDD